MRSLPLLRLYAYFNFGVSVRMCAYVHYCFLLVLYFSFHPHFCLF